MISLFVLGVSFIVLRGLGALGVRRLSSWRDAARLALAIMFLFNEATLSEGMRWVARLALPAAAVLMALAFFLSVLSSEATEPNAMIYLAYVAGVVLAVGLLVLAVGLVRRPLTPREG